MFFEAMDLYRTGVGNLFRTAHRFAQCIPYVSGFSHLMTNSALVPHDAVTISSRTGTGPRLGVCRSLV